MTVLKLLKKGINLGNTMKPSSKIAKMIREKKNDRTVYYLEDGTPVRKIGVTGRKYLAKRHIGKGARDVIVTDRLYLNNPVTAHLRQILMSIEFLENNLKKAITEVEMLIGK